MPPKKATAPASDDAPPPRKPPVYDVKTSPKILRNIGKLPEEVQDTFDALRLDLEEKGPLRTEWPNYRPLKNNYYHCHLNRNWVAVWEWKKKTIVIQIEYVGSREAAPY